MFVYDLVPGQGSCPYHFEYEEEWLLVVEGSVVVRRPKESTPWSRATSSASRPARPERTR